MTQCQQQRHNGVKLKFAEDLQAKWVSKSWWETCILPTHTHTHTWTFAQNNKSILYLVILKLETFCLKPEISEITCSLQESTIHRVVQQSHDTTGKHVINSELQVNFLPSSAGCFIMFHVITNIYNQKTKGPTLMELFTATGKLKKFFFWQLDLSDVCTRGVTAHIDMIFKFLPHARQHGCIDILQCCNDLCL